MNNSLQKKVHVAVGVVRDSNGRVLIAKRAKEQHQGGLWEFPGGKVESSETVLEALIRELKEEVDLTIYQAKPLLQISHDYGDKCVLLDVWLCTNEFGVVEFSGEAKGNENQRVQWVASDQLENFSFPEANKEIVKAIQSNI